MGLMDWADLFMHGAPFVFLLGTAAVDLLGRRGGDSEATEE